MLVQLLKNSRLSKKLGVLNEVVVFILDWRSNSKGIEIPANKQIFDKKHETNTDRFEYDKPDNDGQPYLTIPCYQSGLDAMNNPRQSISR